MSQEITSVQELETWNSKRETQTKDKVDTSTEKLPIVAEWFYDHWMALMEGKKWDDAKRHHDAMVRFHELCTQVSRNHALEAIRANIMYMKMRYSVDADHGCVAFFDLHPECLSKYSIVNGLVKLDN